MGLLTSFFKRAKPLLQLHSGSFSMDRSGRILATTLPTSFPQNLVLEIGRCIVETFRSGQTAQLPLSELVIHYPGLKITAREMRGGAIVFLSAADLNAPTQQTS